MNNVSEIGYVIHFPVGRKLQCIKVGRKSESLYTPGKIYTLIPGKRKSGLPVILDDCNTETRGIDAEFVLIPELDKFEVKVPDSREPSLKVSCGVVRSLGGKLKGTAKVLDKEGIDTGIRLPVTYRERVKTEREVYDVEVSN